MLSEFFCVSKAIIVVSITLKCTKSFDKVLTTCSLLRRCNDREEARRSWGPADKEEGNRDFWASIQEPYNYIMGSNLIPDSYQVTGSPETVVCNEKYISLDF